MGVLRYYISWSITWSAVRAFSLADKEPSRIKYGRDRLLAGRVGELRIQRRITLPVMFEPSQRSLRLVPIFAGLDEESLSRLGTLLTEFEAPAGQVLAEVGQAGMGCFIIEEGSVRVDLPGGNSVELGPGDFFGELSVLTDRPRVGRVVATSDVRAMAIRRNDLMVLLHREPSIAVAMLQGVALRLVEAES